MGRNAHSIALYDVNGIHSSGSSRPTVTIVDTISAFPSTLLFSILPALVVLSTAVNMLRASGAVEMISQFCSPVFSFFGIPPETAMLVLIRPISGSAALAVGADLMAEYGPDSLIGRTAAVMLGSTETTFYTVSVYFGAAGVKKTRYALPAALFADLVGFCMASWSVRLLY